MPIGDRSTFPGSIFVIIWSVLLVVNGIINHANPWLTALYSFGGGLLLGAETIDSVRSKRELKEHKQELADTTALRQQLALYEQRFGVLHSEAGQ